MQSHIDSIYGPNMAFPVARQVGVLLAMQETQGLN